MLNPPTGACRAWSMALCAALRAHTAARQAVCRLAGRKASEGWGDRCVESKHHATIAECAIKENNERKDQFRTFLKSCARISDMQYQQLVGFEKRLLSDVIQKLFLPQWVVASINKSLEDFAVVETASAPCCAFNSRFTPRYSSSHFLHRVA